jgi:hypothetical protein
VPLSKDEFSRRLDASFGFLKDVVNDPERIDAVPSAVHFLGHAIVPGKFSVKGHGVEIIPIISAVLGSSSVSATWYIVSTPLITSPQITGARPSRGHTSKDTLRTPSARMSA